MVSTKQATRLKRLLAMLGPRSPKLRPRRRSRVARTTELQHCDSLVNGRKEIQSGQQNQATEKTDAVETSKEGKSDDGFAGVTHYDKLPSPKYRVGSTEWVATDFEVSMKDVLIKGHKKT